LKIEERANSSTARREEGLGIRASALFLALFTKVPRRSQAVEKVVVGPIGGPKEALNKAKTLQNGVFSF
jgi:hypothetical protein